MTIKRFDQFIKESNGFPNAAIYYVSELTNHCKEEFDRFLKRSRWYNYTNDFNVEFDKDEIDPRFPVSSVDVKFQVSVRHTGDIHQDSAGSFMGYVKEEDIDEDGNLKITIEVKILLDANRRSLSKEKIYLEIEKTIRHEIQHAYEAYLVNIKRGEPSKGWINDWHINNSDVVLGLDSLRNFLYLMYFCQSEERNAHLAQVINDWDSRDLLSTIDELIDFNYILYYNQVWKEAQHRNVKEDDFSMVVRRLISDYNDFCDDTGLTPLTKMVNLENKSLLKFMKYWQPIFHRFGKKMRRKLLRKGNLEYK